MNGFEKIFLKAGEKRKVAFEIKEEMLRFYTASGEFKSEKGKFIVFVGTNSVECLEEEFWLTE